MKRKAFTLIELLVTIAIIAILASILFPVFARARENARRASCMSNLKQIGLAVYMYSQDYDERLVPQQIYGPGKNGTLAAFQWNYCISPYVKSDQIYMCPSRSQLSLGTYVSPGTGYKSAKTNYGYNFSGQPTDGLVRSGSTNYPMGGRYNADGTIYGSSTILTLAAVPDPSGTIAIGDAVVWTQADADGLAYYSDQYAQPFMMWKAANPTTGSTPLYPDPRHLEGANFVFLDGHAKWQKTPLASTMFSVNQD